MTYSAAIVICFSFCLFMSSFSVADSVSYPSLPELVARADFIGRVRIENEAMYSDGADGVALRASVTEEWCSGESHDHIMVSGDVSDITEEWASEYFVLGFFRREADDPVSNETLRVYRVKLGQQLMVPIVERLGGSDEDVYMSHPNPYVAPHDVQTNIDSYGLQYIENRYYLSTTYSRLRQTVSAALEEVGRNDCQPGL